MVKTRFSYSSSGEELLPSLKTDQAPRKQRMAERAENDAVEARFRQLESNIEAIFELLQELKQKSNGKEPESFPEVPKKEPNSSKTDWKGIFATNEDTPPPKNPFRVEAKVEIKPYDGEMNPEKLNNWLRQIEVYFSCYSFSDKMKIYFSRLKMEGYALLSGKAYVKKES